MDAAPATPSTLPTTPPAPPAPLPPAMGRRSGFVAAALGWTIPGLGQVYVGRPLKGLLMLVTIGGLFALGLFLTGFTCVDPYSYGLEFVAHMWIGGPTAAAYWLSRDIVLVEAQPYFEVGRLYAAVAGLLNLVAICDALGGVIEHNEAATERNAARAAELWNREAAALAAVEESTDAGDDLIAFDTQTSLHEHQAEAERGPDQPQAPGAPTETPPHDPFGSPDVSSNEGDLPR